jgi:hypothetical protein
MMSRAGEPRLPLRQGPQCSADTFPNEQFLDQNVKEDLPFRHGLGASGLPVPRPLADE